MSTDNQIAELNNRVAKLERSGRRWRFAFAALALVVVGVAAGPFKSKLFDDAETIVTKRVIFINDKEEQVGLIGTPNKVDGDLPCVVIGSLTDGPGTAIFAGRKSIMGTSKEGERFFIE